ncbi:MAG: hypothetical protein V7K54_00575 [Nostoc sp.]
MLLRGWAICPAHNNYKPDTTHPDAKFRSNCRIIPDRIIGKAL